MSLKSISRIIALATLLIIGLFIVLLIDDEQKIQNISRDITQASTIVSSSMTRTRTLLQFTFIFETVLLAALVGFILLGLSQRVLHPLNALRSDLRAAEHDHLHVIASTGPKEIAQVAADAEHLRRSLVNQTDLAAQSTTARGVPARAPPSTRSATHAAKRSATAPAGERSRGGAAPGAQRSGPAAGRDAART